MEFTERELLLGQENIKIREQNAELRRKLQEQYLQIRELEMSRLLLDSIAAYSSDAFITYDLENLTCLQASSACKSILGYEPKALEGRLITALLHPDDCVPFKNAVNSAMNATPAEVKCHWLHQDGSYVYLGIILFVSDTDHSRTAVVLMNDFNSARQSDDYVQNQNQKLRNARDELKLANSRLRQSEESLNMAMWAASQGMWDWDVASGRIIINAQINEMLGWYDHPLETTILEWNQMVHPDDRQRVLEEFKNHALTRTEVFEVQYRIRNCQHRYLWVVDRGRVIARNEAGHGARVVGMRREIGREKALELELLESRNRYRTLLDTIPEIIVQVKANGYFVWVNDQGREFFGDQVMEHKIQDYHVKSYAGEDIMTSLAKLQNRSNEALVLENKFVRRDGQHCVLRWQCKPMKSPEGISCILGTARDVTEIRRNEEKVRFMSFHDRLTGVYNRAFVEEEMNRLDVERQLPISIIVGDVNALKLTNDTFGHFEGDRLLTNLAEILRKNCRDEDIIARWGGDEFVIFLPRTSLEEAELICSRIKEACRRHPVDPIKPSIAMGIATKTDMLDSLYGVITEAENHMYQNKQLESHEYRQVIIESLEKRLYLHSKESPDHIARLKNMADLFGQQLGLSSLDTERLRLLARLHDIGNISIDSKILNKRGPLSPEEWDIIKKHPEMGMRIAQSSNDLSFLSEDIFHHHEHWDGQGYPLGLKGKNIPLKSRIFAILDAYEAMTSPRQYRDAYTHEQALEEIRHCSGQHFDPELVNHFINIFD